MLQKHSCTAAGNAASCCLKRGIPLTFSPSAAKISDMTDKQKCKNNIAVILEAAGNSTRFGSNKLLHETEDGRPMISSILGAVREASQAFGQPADGPDPGTGRGISMRRILVTQYDEIAALAPDFEVVMNTQPQLGISRSMQLGIEAAGDADAYMFCVCDQPGLTAASIANLIEAFCAEADAAASDPDEGRPAPIVSLSWQGKMYNPKIFSSFYRDELMSLSGDTGGRQIIAAHKDALLTVEAGSGSEVLDIDSKEEAGLSPQ